MCGYWIRDLIDGIGIPWRGSTTTTTTDRILTKTRNEKLQSVKMLTGPVITGMVNGNLSYILQPINYSCRRSVSIACMSIIVKISIGPLASIVGIVL